jgi:hypothetical protein
VCERSVAGGGRRAASLGGAASIHSGSSLLADAAGQLSLPTKLRAMEMPSPTALRLAGVAALFVALGALLAGESSDLSRREAGTIALVFGLAMIAMHVYVRRGQTVGSGPADASLAALIAVLTVPPGSIAVLWDSGIGNSSDIIYFRVSRDGIGNGLLLSAAVFGVAYLLARDARWLLVAPIALVGGIEFHLLGSGDVSSLGDGSWPRFLVLLAASAGLAVTATRSAPAERHNLLLAAALIVPFAFVSYPSGGDASVRRDLVGAALLAGLTMVTWRRLSPGIGFATVLMALFEVSSLSAHGQGLGPALVFAIAGAALLVGGFLSRPSSPTPRASSS